MKNLFLFLCLFLLLCTGCKYFKRSSSRTVDTLTADTSSASSEVVDSAALFAGMNNGLTNNVEAPGRTSAVSGTYYMIVGCFTVQKNADNYAEKLRGTGYQAQIITGIGNYQMVSARTYSSYRESISEIEKFRNEVTPNAWVYLKR
jgi:hypothetical protein